MGSPPVAGAPPVEPPVALLAVSLTPVVVNTNSPFKILITIEGGKRKHTLSGIANTLGSRASGVAYSLASTRDSVANSIGQALSGLANGIGETAESTFTFVSSCPDSEMTEVEEYMYLCCQTYRLMIREKWKVSVLVLVDRIGSRREDEEEGYIYRLK